MNELENYAVSVQNEVDESREEKATILRKQRKVLDTISLEELRKKFHYDPETGVFTALEKFRQTRYCLHPGNFNGNGYLGFTIRKVRYENHRLAWFYMTGEWPPYEIDHKNGIKTDNRWVNLRKATQAQNQQNCFVRKNNSSGAVGVTPTKGKRWVARIKLNGLRTHLGTFSSLEAARSAYLAAKRNMHPFANFDHAALDGKGGGG